MTTSSPDVVTRFAPSPTGHLHIGGARTALFNWALARRSGGVFLLRIEDTDQARSSDAATTRILDNLAWLGVDWDEGPELTVGDRTLGGDPRNIGPFHQARRLKLYEEHINTLLEADRAYHAFETPEELEAQRDIAKKEKRAFRYDRAALRIPRDERFQRAASGERHVVRFHVPDEEIVVRDEVLGEVRLAPGETDDFVIRKADGYPTYHLAVVVDDELMGVTHVVRGQEHLINTPRHVALQRALGFRTPVYAHLPLIVNVDGSKMSKRDKDKAARKAARDAGLIDCPAPGVDPDRFAAWMKDKNRQLDQNELEAIAAALDIALPEIDVEDFRAAGYLPEVICNYIALLGWSPGDDIEKFDMDFLAQRFDPKRIGKTNARFDYRKLLAFNNDAFAAMSDDEFARRWRLWCLDHAPELLDALGAMDEVNDAFLLLAGATRPRCKTFRDGVEGARFLLTPDDEIQYDEKAVEKALRKNDGEGIDTLRALRAELEHAQPWAPQRLHELVASFAEARGVGMGKVAQPLRVALTGGAVSPPIDATLAALGRQRTLGRIDRCLREIA